MSTDLKSKKVLMTWGGWDGHSPEACTNLVASWLKDEGADVEIVNNLTVYEDHEKIAACDLIIPNHTMDTLPGPAWRGINKAIKAGTGFGGWHGGAGDAFRGHVEFQEMVGGQFLCHPGGIIDYEVEIVSEDPIVSGFDKISVNSEQYYMLVDPRNEVLAQSVFSAEHRPEVGGVVMPTIWKKSWGNGRVFYSAIGHAPSDLEAPEVKEITIRGLRWACR
jgi:uncharacterized protein